jgi:hypothetical protein
MVIRRGGYWREVVLTTLHVSATFTDDFAMAFQEILVFTQRAKSNGT